MALTPKIFFFRWCVRQLSSGHELREIVNQSGTSATSPKELRWLSEAQRPAEASTEPTADYRLRGEFAA
jgi:hypothetical protein